MNLDGVDGVDGDSLSESSGDSSEDDSDDVSELPEVSTPLQAFCERCCLGRARQVCQKPFQPREVGTAGCRVSRGDGAGLDRANRASDKSITRKRKSAPLTCAKLGVAKPRRTNWHSCVPSWRC